MPPMNGLESAHSGSGLDGSSPGNKAIHMYVTCRVSCLARQLRYVRLVFKKVLPHQEVHCPSPRRHAAGCLCPLEGGLC